MKSILVTGGLGFIGSHTCVELISQGFNPIVIDSLENSEIWIKDRIEQITNKDLIFYKGDCTDKSLLRSIFSENKIHGVIHFAAYKAVGESVQLPLKYYENNLIGLIAVLDVANESGCKNFVFSSSCTVYGAPDELPVSEKAPIKNSESPYGTSKIFGEKIIADFVAANQDFKAVLLRYFNPIGAHKSSLIGELPKGIPSSLVPYAVQTAAGKRDTLTVFGDDYDTKDGSCIRDFIHVTDVSCAHIKAFEYLDKQNATVCEPINIGVGEGVSVFELLKKFKEATGASINFAVGPRRDGDIAAVYADPTKSNKVLGWKSELSIEQALIDAWNWQKTLD